MPAPYYGHLIADNVIDKTNYIGRIDSHATLPGYIAIYSAADVLLSRKNFSKPSGTVDASTGLATLTPSGTETTAVAGTAAYAVIADGAGQAHTYLECVASSVAVQGKCALATLDITAGLPMSYQNITL